VSEVWLEVVIGPLAGVVPNFDLALDVAYAVRTLLYPGMKLTGYASYEAAVKTLQEAAKRVAAAADSDAGVAKLLYIAALADAPSRTQTFDGSTRASRVKATLEALVTALGFSTLARYDVEQRFGGNPSSNVGTDYAESISAAEAAGIDAVRHGAVGRFNARLQAGDRVAADPAAESLARQHGGDPQGGVTAPTITLHTADDPLVIVANESFFRARYERSRAAGTATSELVSLFTTPPARYPQRPGAPYGAGHCNFTAHSRLAVIDLLNRWVTSGTAPTPAEIATAMGPDSGYDPGFTPPPWPEPGLATGG
jgi:hypothetical protein